MTTTPANGRLRVDVQIHNRQTGHHVPTGVTIRNMVLIVEAWRVDDARRLLQAAGPRVDALGGVGDPMQGYYAGLPGKLYAKHSHDAGGDGPTFFTEATGITWDNRIPALATDATSYDFVIPPGIHTLRVRARLVYRRSFRALVDAKGWTTDGHGAPLEDIQPPYFGHLMEESSWQGPGTGAVRSFGASCRGLVATSEGDPSIGTRDFALTLTGAPPNALRLLSLGLDDAQWSGLPLPFDLTLAGAPGCWILASIDLTDSGTVGQSGAARLLVPIPFGVPPGGRFLAQWFVADPALPLGLATSNASAVTIQR